MYVASFDFCNTWLALLPWNVNNYAFLDALASLAFKLSQNNTHIFSQYSLHCSTTSLKYVCDLWLFQYLSVYGPIWPKSQKLCFLVSVKIQKLRSLLCLVWLCIFALQGGVWWQPFHSPLWWLYCVKLASDIENVFVQIVIFKITKCICVQVTFHSRSHGSIICNWAQILNMYLFNL